MIKTESIDFHSHLPPYRSLLSPNARYDYQSHSLVPISQNELNNLKKYHMALRSQSNQKMAFKMKYKSLLNDVSRKKSKLSIKISNQNFSFLNQNQQSKLINHNTTTAVPEVDPMQFKNLPIEIQYNIFGMLDKHDLRNCSFVNKHFYKLSKRFLYQEVTFDSSYRFAQFVTLLRSNPKLGKLVQSIDLSNIKPCNYELERELESNDSDASKNSDEVSIYDESKIKSGWRDWKFSKNPLYSTNPPLYKIQSQSQSSMHSFNNNKKKKLNLSFLKRNKRNKLNHEKSYSSNELKHELATTRKPHPPINKYLLSFSNTKDIPIGYLIHLINLCPNLISVNLANVSLSTDYEVDKRFIYKFTPFDVIHNYPNNLLGNIENVDDSNSIYNLNINGRDNESIFSVSSNATTINGGSNNSKAVPTWKYNSLLAPETKTNCVNKSDKKLFLSDLNLKSINNQYLTKTNEKEILTLITKLHSHNVDFKYLNMSSIIWLNKSLIQTFLSKFLTKRNISDKFQPRNMIIDLTNSGMYKNLLWAKRFDLNTAEGHDLVVKLLNDELYDEFETYIMNERERRGRIAENYLH